MSNDNTVIIFVISCLVLFFLFCAAIIVGSIRSAAKAREKIARLQVSGFKVAASVINVVHWRTSHTVTSHTGPNGEAQTRTVWRDHYQLEVVWVDPRTNQPHQFKSQEIGGNLANAYKPGMLVQVLIDPQNLSEYHVEVLSN